MLTCWGGNKTGKKICTGQTQNAPEKRMHGNFNDARKRVNLGKKPAHLPDNDSKKFKTNLIRDHNRSMKRLQNEGQVTMARLIGNDNSISKISGNDSDFEPATVQKRAKKCKS